MTEKFSSRLYPKEAVIKTAYSFTGRCYVHLDMDGENYVISLTGKDENSADNDMLKKELDNEIISQLVRYTVSHKTSEVRQLLLGRAFSSSLIAEEKELPEYGGEYIPSAEKILKDWFENNAEHIEA